MKVNCLYDRMVPISELKAHPSNANRHPEDQVTRLAKILEYQGFRYPVKVSKQTGYITSGHGRVLAAQLNGWTEVPVSDQHYESNDQELADLHADNAIASWAELDLGKINLQIPELSPDFSLDLFGIRGFQLDPKLSVNFEASAGSKELGSDGFQNFAHACPRCGFNFD